MINMVPCKTSQDVENEICRAAEKRLASLVKEVASRLTAAISKSPGARPDLNISHDIFLLARMVAGSNAFNTCETQEDLLSLIRIVVSDYDIDVADYILEMERESFARYCRDHHLLLPQNLPSVPYTSFQLRKLAGLLHLDFESQEVMNDLRHEVDIAGGITEYITQCRCPSDK